MTHRPMTHQQMLCFMLLTQFWRRSMGEDFTGSKARQIWRIVNAVIDAHMTKDPSQKLRLRDALKSIVEGTP